MCPRALFAGFVVTLATAAPAGAVLRHYEVQWTTISEFNIAVPSLQKSPAAKGGPPSDSKGIVEDTNNGHPVLKRLALVSDVEITINIVCLSGFVFLNMHFDEGPRKGLSFTGTGDTDATIAWGLVTGWTITGGFWCHSVFSSICLYGGGVDLETLEPQLLSPIYDLGTWTFHGTGFTAAPFVHHSDPTANMAVGNAQYQLKGRLASGIVPAVPALGVALLAAGLVFSAARLVGRR